MWESFSEEESVKKSECGLSCWLVLPTARKSRERMCALSCWQVCPARKACMEDSERMLPRLFIVTWESDLDRIAWNILIGRKYEFGTKTVKIFLHQTIIWNSFCYKLLVLRHTNTLYQCSQNFQKQLSTKCIQTSLSGADIVISLKGCQLWLYYIFY